MLNYNKEEDCSIVQIKKLKSNFISSVVHHLYLSHRLPPSPLPLSPLPSPLPLHSPAPKELFLHLYCELVAVFKRMSHRKIICTCGNQKLEVTKLSYEELTNGEGCILYLDRKYKPLNG